MRKIDTRGKWIDIIDHDNNNPSGYYGKYSPDLHIICKLYPRLTRPVYPPKPNTDDEYLLERYQMEVDAITWKVAHSDINTHKCNNKHKDFPE